MSYSTPDTFSDYKNALARWHMYHLPKNALHNDTVLYTSIPYIELFAMYGIKQNLHLEIHVESD